VSGNRRHCPVTILTGFLGAGKTTLLRRALAGPNASGVAVVINEFGSEGLDHEFVLDGSDDAEVVAGGCACCSRREELARVLARIWDEHERGVRARLDRVVIETSGLADPAPIAFTIASDPVLQHHFKVDAIVATVDASAAAGQLQDYPEALKQIEVADRVIVTKRDLAGRRAVRALQARLHEINPSTELARPPDLLSPGLRPAHVVSVNQPSEAVHTGGVASLTLEPNAPVDWMAFGVWLSMLLHRHGERVLRVKGVVEAEEFGPVLVNAVQHVISPPEHLTEVRDRGLTRLVLILRDLSPALVERSFRVFQEAA
jgi:G3E family GTPase